MSAFLKKLPVMGDLAAGFYLSLAPLFWGGKEIL
jgi:hypothetical protein